jgi:membrane-bound serine protease (ClpP class)
MRVKLATALAVSVPLGVITVFLMTVALRARRNKITTGVEGLIGEVAIVQTPLAPSGKVFVHGEIWDAVSTTNVPAGERVVVHNVDGLQLKVDPLQESQKTTVV